MRFSLVKNLKLGLVASSLLALSSLSATAQDVTLRLHQFLPSPALIPAKIMVPWANSVEEASNGRIKIEHFDAMSLGGKPPALMDQAKDGVVDIVMTLPGYTPGRFVKTEVFELPFMMKSPEAMALAFWELVDSELQAEEYRDVKILGAWVHGPGVIHSKDPIASVADMNGKKLRGPTRVINSLLKNLGATPVGMPVPAVPEALSKGVIDGTVIPWEVTGALKVPELVSNHTEFGGERALYTAAFVLAMNKDKWDSMPADLQEAMMSVSGPKLSAMAANAMLAGDAPSREKAAANGNNIITLDADAVKEWQDAAMPVIESWKNDMKGIGIDGDALIKRAQEMMSKHEM